jgi:hypothetical protein
MYKYDLKYHIFGEEGYGGNLTTRSDYKYMRDVIQENPPKENFLWLADIQEGIQRSLYVDNLHYTAEFSKLLAKEIASYISERNLIPVH